MLHENILDPRRRRAVVGEWSPSGPLPQTVRNFGYVPDVFRWLPGDLILTSPLRPNHLNSMITRMQQRGGYDEKDSRWTHAAMYAGDGMKICEARPFAQRCGTIYPYIGDH